jgi:hypothetical protein
MRILQQSFNERRQLLLQATTHLVVQSADPRRHGRYAVWGESCAAAVHRKTNERRDRRRVWTARSQDAINRAGQKRGYRGCGASGLAGFFQQRCEARPIRLE